MEITDRPILYFDGVCNLCNRSVQFIIRHDKQKVFLFAPLQGQAGQVVIAHLQPNMPDSVVLGYKGEYYTQSDAVLKVLRLLGGAWSPLVIFYIIPRAARNGMYKMMARSRYKWFGKTDSCMIPTPALKARFLD